MGCHVSFHFPAVFVQARTMPNLSEPESSHEISALGDLTAGSGMAAGKILSYKMKESMFKDGFWQLYRNESQHTGTSVPALQQERAM